jgi:hypothetical protein
MHCRVPFKLVSKHVHNAAYHSSTSVIGSTRQDTLSRPKMSLPEKNAQANKPPPLNLLPPWKNKWGPHGGQTW